MPNVKTPEERGPLGWWAYEARSEILDIKDQAVVEMLGKYDTATIRKAESDSKNMSGPLWRAHVPLYQRLAREHGKTLREPPDHPGRPKATTDVTALVAAINDLVTEMRLARERDQDAAAAMLRAAEALLSARRPAEAAASTEPDVPLGSAQ